ncbi:recombinase family protein [uncultured Microbacterium sp.]|uniref:recombinase family protein n=1 Tax=uncultured Microbacterium sp. TaxID=191216 RepID=UPI0026083FFC|nr:recombinase family protein [uncultured Microbacterium sp.]
MKTNARKAAIYARISVEDENVPKVEHQVAACRALAGDDYTIAEAHVFTDPGIPATGKSIREGTRAKRPGFDALLYAAERGEFDAIIAVAGDRLARNYPDGLDIVDACAAGDVVLLLDDDGVLDPRTPGGEERAMSLFTGGRREIRTRSAKQRRRYDAETLQGMPLWGRRPFGFDWVEEVNRHGKVSRRATIHNEREAEAIRWAVEWFPTPEGSLYGIIAEWKRRGLTTTAAGYARRKPVAGDVAFSGDWTNASVRSILTNPRIAGLVKRGGEIVTGDDGQPIKAAWEPIVGREAWQAVLDKLADPTRHTAKGRKPHSVGSGIALCVCGLPLRATTIKGKPRDERGVIIAEAEPVKLPGLRCDVSRNQWRERMDVPRHVSVRDDVLNPLIADAVAAAFLFGPADLIPSGAVDLRPVEAELAELREAEANAAALALLGGVAGGIATARIVEIHARVAELQAARVEAVSASAHAAMVVDLRAELWGGERVNIADAAEAKRALRERFESLPLGQRRELVRVLLAVRVLPGQGVKLAPERRVRIVHKVVTSLNDAEAADVA